VNLESVQEETLTYKSTPESFAKQLETEIEETLNEKIREWRSRFVTRWNRFENIRKKNAERQNVGDVARFWRNYWENASNAS
jgi:hypothetical protein